MKCPYCSHENTRVIDSRPAEDNNSIRRRRVCDECGKRFTTYEKIETIPLIVIKKDENREPYDRSKIEAGVLRACHKRPISINQINQLVDEVETEIFNREEKEIPSRVIGELVMDKLESGSCSLCQICFCIPGVQGYQYLYGRTEEGTEIKKTERRNGESRFPQKRKQS